MNERIFDSTRDDRLGRGQAHQQAPPGWSSRVDRRPPWTTMGGFAPAGGVISTLGDMARLAVALLDGSAPGSGSFDTDRRRCDRRDQPGDRDVLGHRIGPRDRPPIGLAQRPDRWISRPFWDSPPIRGRAVIVLANVAQVSDQQRIAFELMGRFAARVRSDPND